MAELFLDDALVERSFGEEVLDLGSNSISSPITVDGGEVSGGSASQSIAQAAAQIEEFASEGGGALALFWGENLIAGHLILSKYTTGPSVLIVHVALGEGQGNRGNHGECNAAVTVWYSGEALSVSPDGSTDGYRFYSGFISTGVASGPQQVDAFISAVLAYSGTCYVAVRLSGALADQQRADRIRVRARGRNTFNYNSNGQQIDYGYSTNPARVAADGILSFFERKISDLTTARRAFEERIDWPSWVAWRDFNDVQISWDPGTGSISIKRFEFHGAVTQDMILADFLDLVCASCGAFWLDDGQKISFITPAEQTPIHHFNETNIIEADPEVTPRDLRERPNYFIAEYRDIRDPFLGLRSVEVRREGLIAQTGEIKSTRAFTNMEQSQAQRLLERQARLEADNPYLWRFIADETATHVLPGRFVTVSHQIPGWEYKRCLVLAVTARSAEDSPDTYEITVQAIEDSLYTDITHGPRQPEVAP